MNSKNIILTTLLLFFITLEVLIALDYAAKQRDLGKKRIAIFSHFIELQNQIGYAGFIHNFKNFVLRPDEQEYGEKATKNYHNALAELVKIEQLAKPIVSSLTLPHTRAMLEAYKQKLDLIEQLRAQNLNSNEIDKTLRYDDTPSQLEIQKISSMVAYELDAHIIKLLYRSLLLGGLVMLALVITLIAIIHFFFKEQQKLLKLQNQQNSEMQQHKTDMQRSQTILLSVMQDVDKEKRQAAEFNKKLKAKNKEMEQFIYTVSHDLKSPLVTIGGFSQTLLSELQSQLSEKQGYRLTRILENVKHMENLLFDLLSLSKVAQQQIVTEQIKLKPLIQTQVLALENALNQAQGQIIYTDYLHTITANPRLLAQAVLNLLSNAIRYREPKRPLIIEISTSRSLTSTTLHVKDNGLGIDKKYQQKVFNIFERLSEGEGTGVGLTIVKTIMDKHIGKVSLVSEPDKGSCFSLTFLDYPPGSEK